MSIRKAYHSATVYNRVQAMKTRPAKGSRSAAILGVGSVLFILATAGVFIGIM